MTETIMVWINVLVLVLATLYLLTDLIANKPSNKINIVIIAVVAAISAMYAYKTATGIHIVNGMTTSISIVLLAMFLIIGKIFLQNIRETILIIKKKVWKEDNR